MSSVVVFVCQFSGFFFDGSYCATLVSHVCTRSCCLVSVQRTFFDARPRDVFWLPSKWHFLGSVQRTFFDACPNNVFWRPSKLHFLAPIELTFFGARPNEVYWCPSKTTYFGTCLKDVFGHLSKWHFLTPVLQSRAAWQPWELLRGTFSCYRAPW
jgi:hypothetical protein